MIGRQGTHVVMAEHHPFRITSGTRLREGGREGGERERERKGGEREREREGEKERERERERERENDQSYYQLYCWQ